MQSDSTAESLGTILQDCRDGQGYLWAVSEQFFRENIEDRAQTKLENAFGFLSAFQVNGIGDQGLL